MKSPRFPLRESDLKSIISSSKLRDVWKLKVRKSLRKQVLPDPIDYLDFHLNLKIECERIEKLVFSGSYTTEPSRRLLMEKSKGLCRQIVIPGVREALILQILADALWKDLKGKAPSEHAHFLPEDHAFSKSDELFHEPEYGSFRAWLDFQRERFKFAEEREYMIVTDISNYYDCISYVHLRNVISGLVDIRECVLDMLIFVLSGLLWQPDYMPRVEIGLPQIDLDAPRMLAHCFLFELDKVVKDHFKVDYTRYMDDIDVGVDSYPEAKRLLKAIDLTLQTRQIRINSGKTKILKREDAFKHFFIRENRILDVAAKRVNKKMEAGEFIIREMNYIKAKIESLYQKRKFDAGNGEKILKRLINMAILTKSGVDDSILEDIILYRPGVRKTALKAIPANPMPLYWLEKIEEMLASNMFVDDVALIQIGITVLEARMDKIPSVRPAILRIANLFDHNEFAGLYTRIMLLSKYGRLDDLLSELRNCREQWYADVWLGRLVGSLYPLFICSKHYNSFQHLISNSRNIGAEAAFRFHDELYNSAKFYGKIRNFLRTRNTSKTLRISHQKFLMVMTALKSSKVNNLQKKELLRIHYEAWGDIFYSALRRKATFGIELSLRDVVKEH